MECSTELEVAAQEAAAQEAQPTAVSLANASFDTGRAEVPESTLGGETTCIICFTNPKSHVVPCGHHGTSALAAPAPSRYKHALTAARR